MAARLEDNNGVIDWEDNTGLKAFVDDLGNFTLSAAGNEPVLNDWDVRHIYTEGDSAITLSPNIFVTDPDSANLTSGSAIITTGLLTGDLLAATTTATSITATYTAGTGTLALSGSDTLAHYGQVLRTVTYSSSSSTPTNAGANQTRIISWKVNDGALDSNIPTTKITVYELNPIAPVLGSVAATASYTEAATATVLAPSLTITDADSLVLQYARVVLAGNSVASDRFLGDTLTADTTGVPLITAQWLPGSGSLDLDGEDTLAHYQQVLRTVAYSNSRVGLTAISGAGGPTQGSIHPNRIVSWRVNDGTISSNIPTTTITVYEREPWLSGFPETMGGDGSVTRIHLSYTEGSAAIALCPALVINTRPGAVNLAGATVTIPIASVFTGDLLTASTAGTSITTTFTTGAGAPATNLLTLSGTDTIAHYQQVLRTVAYSSSSSSPTNGGANPSRDIVFDVNDGTYTGSGYFSSPDGAAYFYHPPQRGVLISEFTGEYPAQSGSYLITGSAATLTATGGGPTVLTAANGSYSLTGSAAALTASGSAGATVVLMPAGCM